MIPRLFGFYQVYDVIRELLKGVTWFHRCVIHTLLKVHIGKINKELFEFFKNIDFWLRYADYANYVNCSMSHVKK